MPVNLKPPAALAAVSGIRLGVAQAGIRRPGHPDLTLISLSPGTRCAATFTRNRFCAAPVSIAREHLSAFAPRALLVNTGYANAGTGTAGTEDALACCRAVAAELRCRPEEILPFSTGIIGMRLPVERIVRAVPGVAASLSGEGWLDAARAIMTTDTVPKGASRTVQGAHPPVTITGIAKGAGMLEPNMATMLAFIATDADIPGDLLRDLCTEAVGQSFNRITVDGDTSTNDACVLMATGGSGVQAATLLEPFRAALREVCDTLAQAMIRDAEGASKFVTIDVVHARSVDEAAKVAYAIARSPLVKTALFASDPNWGRILAAAGNAVQEPADIATVSLHLNGVCAFRNGAPADGYTEAAGVAAMRRDEIQIVCDLGHGAHGARVWTSDLSHEYVRINGEYRS
ncbi:MAG: bifunctional glutamate N-acetyltransferase/amino-acid acetyltransferase ArgJ [Acidiferrobacteraceae bacterium]